MSSKKPRNYPLPANEKLRVQAVRNYEIFDTEEDKHYDALTSLAAMICQMPIALITFIDNKRQWFKSHHGTNLNENLREYSFCTHAIASEEEIMVVDDATKDARFAENPMVTGPTKVAFYAGVPLVNSDGFALGTLCVFDHQPRELNADQKAALVIVANQVIDKIELRKNISELAAVNLHLEQSEQRKDNFLSIVSHELKTPITTLKANLQMLERIKSDPLSPIFPRLVESCTKSVEKINLMVEDLLNMHRYSEDQLHLDKTTFCIYDLMHVCCNHVRIDGKYELIVEGDKNQLIHADEHRIDQVLVNFVNNAVKYAPDSRQINLKISREAENIKIAVTDFGPGIPEEHLPHLFDRYWRANHSSKKYTGLGLGLYICAEIVRRHDGNIGVYSKLGEGSTFWFTIPTAD
ncbi:ATP-binding protein [Pedobacter sp. JCM 36344]|uniref:GAF domain-containing sensor histidine kinase n=1 Tax=Pedobacter sp. JCM 36344 TaxID=3374280 RepID=UPI00397B8E1F